MAKTAAPAERPHRQPHLGGRVLARIIGLRSGNENTLTEHRTPPEVPEANPVELQYPWVKPENLKSNSVDIASNNPSILSAEDVHNQTELDLGALKAVISLPQPQPWIPEDYKTMKIYLFEQSSPDGEHGSDEKSYLLLTSEQITTMRAAAQANDETMWEEATRGSVTINAQNPTLKIGRGEGGWLPGIGTDQDRLGDPEIAARYETISRQQATVSIDAQGGLHIADLGSKNGTNVYFMPNSVAGTPADSSRQLVNAA